MNDPALIFYSFILDNLVSLLNQVFLQDPLDTFFCVSSPVGRDHGPLKPDLKRLAVRMGIRIFICFRNPLLYGLFNPVPVKKQNIIRRGEGLGAPGEIGIRYHIGYICIVMATGSGNLLNRLYSDVFVVSLCLNNDLLLPFLIRQDEIRP